VIALTLIGYVVFILGFLIVTLRGEPRTYHHVPLAQVAKSQLTHIDTCGFVVYVRKQQDGDWHLTLTEGKAKLVVEIIPAIPLPVPKKGQWMRVRGIRRFDEYHNFAEIHPAEVITVVPRCP
jgi:hypothetical protein